MLPVRVFHDAVPLADLGTETALSVYEDGTAMATFIRAGMSTHVHFSAAETRSVLALFARAAGAERISAAPSVEDAAARGGV